MKLAKAFVPSFSDSISLLLGTDTGDRHEHGISIIIVEWLGKSLKKSVLKFNYVFLLGYDIGGF